jgi:hypothetical protein
MKKPTETESLKRDVAILINRVNGLEANLDALKPKPPKKVTKYFWVFQLGVKPEIVSFGVTLRRHESAISAGAEVLQSWPRTTIKILHHIPESAETTEEPIPTLSLTEFLARTEDPELSEINKYSAFQIATYISRYRYLWSVLSDLFKNFSVCYTDKWVDVKYHANVLGANEQIKRIEDRR